MQETIHCLNLPGLSLESGEITCVFYSAKP